jgi:hypothetical protein
MSVTTIGEWCQGNDEVGVRFFLDKITSSHTFREAPKMGVFRVEMPYSIGRE